jgi:hypothetical protein
MERPSSSIDTLSRFWTHLNHLWLVSVRCLRHWVDWPMSEHLSTQGRPDLRGELCCFWCPMVSKQNLNPFSCHIWHTNNCQKWIIIEKVMAPQSKGSEELNKTNHQTLSKPFSNTQKIPCMLLCY